MEHKNQTEEFQYTYSAAEQDELKRIREKYTNREEDKMERLRRLDRRVSERAQTVALVLGILGALILGFGMSLVMSDLPSGLGMPQGLALPLGVLFGCIGGVLVALAYPVYSYVLKSEKKKIAPEILRLTDELMK